MSVVLGTLQSYPWWQSTELWAVVIGTILGFILSEVKASLSKRKRTKAHWAALRAETLFCSRLAETYVEHGLAAPSYRLPTTAYSHSFSALLADGMPTEMNTHALMQFYTEVEALNRGIDAAQGARERGDHSAVKIEFQRNRVKAERLFRVPGSVESYYLPVRNALNEHL